MASARPTVCASGLPARKQSVSSQPRLAGYGQRKPVEPCLFALLCIAQFHSALRCHFVRLETLELEIGVGSSALADCYDDDDRGLHSVAFIIKYHERRLANGNKQTWNIQTATSLHADWLRAMHCRPPGPRLSAHPIASRLAMSRRVCSRLGVSCRLELVAAA